MKKIILTFLTSVSILCGLKSLAFGDDVSSMTSSSSQQSQTVEISSEENVDDYFLNHGHHTHPEVQTETYTETINYYLVGTNKKIAPSTVKEITFKREGYRQVPSQEIVWLEWDHDSESFESIVSPTIKGYTTNTYCTPQITIVPGQGSQRNYEYNIYYTPESNGEINGSSGSIQSSSSSKMSSSSLIKNNDNKLTAKKNVQKEKKISSYSEKNQLSGEMNSRKLQTNKAKNKRIQSVQNSSEKQKSNIKQSAKNNSNNSNFVNSKSKNNIKIQNRSVNTNSKSQQSSSSIASNNKHVMKNSLKNLRQKNSKIENKFNLITDIEKKPILMISGLVATIAIVFELFDQRKSK